MTSLAKRQLHPAVVHLLLAGFGAVCFAFIAASVSRGGSLTGFDREHAIRIHEYAVAHPDVWNFAEFITELGSRKPRITVVVAVTLILLIVRQGRLALFWAATQWLLGEANGLAKEWFARPRPRFEITSYSATGWSFPSGHAAGIMVTYGMIGFLIAWRWPGRWFTWIALSALGAIIILVGLSRMLLGVHWFSDILGGYLFGLTGLSLCVAIIEWQRSKIQAIAG